jgi:hypothetical protein
MGWLRRARFVVERPICDKPRRSLVFNATIKRANCGPEWATYQFQTPQGTLVFTDVGHSQYISPYYWGVTISYGGNDYLYSYNGEGDITFVIDEDGNLSAQYEGPGTIQPINSAESG